MKLEQYQAECQNTKSDAFYGEKVAFDVFNGRLLRAIAALQQLDKVKKTLFYGKDNNELVPDNDASYLNCWALQIHTLHNEPQKGFDLLHAIIGKATEAGELLEALHSAVIANKPLDHVNIKEEIGDGFWYDGIALEALGGSFEECAERNNAKLRRRFPNKFTEQDAINRNLAAEREVLEG